MCSENGIGGNLSAFDIKQFRAPSGAGIARRQAEGSTGRGEPVLRPARRASLTINRGPCQWLTKAAGSTSVVSDDHHAVDVASFSREVGVCFEQQTLRRRHCSSVGRCAEALLESLAMTSLVSLLLSSGASSHFDRMRSRLEASVADVMRMAPMCAMPMQ